MATYCVTLSESDDWGDAADRFKSLPPADKRLLEKIAAGHRLVRLIRWEKGQPTEAARFERRARRHTGRRSTMAGVNRKK
jgi:hypothetical protein